MAKKARDEKKRNRFIKGMRNIKIGMKKVGLFFKKVSQLMQQGAGLVICLGGVCATAGWLLATFRPDPLGATWSASIWLVILGVCLLLLGILVLFTQNILRIGMLGQYSIIIFLFGALILLAGAVSVDLFILPWMAKLFTQFPNLGSVLQSGYDSVQKAANTSGSTIINAGSDVCNTISNPFGGGNPCSTSSTTTIVPSQQIPSLGVDDLLRQIGLPSITTLGTLGAVFLSGAPLAPGCLLLGLVFLFAGVRPRSSLLLLIVAALLNLGGQFLLHLAFLGPFLDVLLYLALIWFGFILWFPWKLSLFGKTVSVHKS